MIKFIFIVSLISIEAIKNNKKKVTIYCRAFSLLCFFIEIFSSRLGPRIPRATEIDPERQCDHTSLHR